MTGGFTQPFSANSIETLSDKINKWTRDFVEECDDNGVFYSISHTFLNPVVFEDQIHFSAVLVVEVSDNEDGE